MENPSTTDNNEEAMDNQSINTQPNVQLSSAFFRNEYEIYNTK